MKRILCFVPFLLVFRLCAQTEEPGHALVSVDKSSGVISNNTVSKNELLIPRKAFKELQHAQHDYASGNIRSSTRHLESALRLYPNYLEARNNLGAQYIELHEYEKAIAELQKAIQMSPSVVQPFNNLSVAFFLLKRYPDAETAARQALVFDPQNSISRYVLGCTLATENRNIPEAVEMLRASKNDFPESRLLLAKIAIRRGDVDEAKRELHDYLAVPGVEKRTAVERWLGQLGGASATRP